MEHPKLRVSIVQAPCKLEDTVHNTKVILDNLRHLSGKTDLVVFPELFISGYRFSIESSDSLSEPACGPTFQAISQAALRHQVAVIYGFAELDVETKRKYISLMWIDCHGDQVLCYRKTHLYDPDLCTFENVVFSAGDALAPVTTILNVKVGVLICWDVEVPEPSRCLAMAGADFIIAIAANTDAKVNDIIVPARSIDNQVQIRKCKCTAQSRPFEIRTACALLACAQY
jgi:predicted amidohydrolase